MRILPCYLALTALALGLSAYERAQQKASAVEVVSEVEASETELSETELSETELSETELSETELSEPVIESHNEVPSLETDQAEIFTKEC